MTRITNFGRKRTYVEAGFANDALVEEPAEPQASTSTLPSESQPRDQAPPKKKRKRTKKPKESGGNDGEGAQSTEGKTQDVGSSEQAKPAPKKKPKAQRKTKGRSIIVSKCHSILKAFSSARSCTTLRNETPETDCGEACRHDLFCMSTKRASSKRLPDNT
jgi:hypothetical protein